ncbi:MAG: TIGR04282 family arsenosugar biosynthesis glycosyltransferase [Paracoccaceae bacterium]
MVKEPRPGRAKTRLGQEIGHTVAARWYRQNALTTLQRLRDPRWEIVLAVAPDHAGLTSTVWPRDLLRFPQGAGDIGDRMERIFRAMPKGPVLIVGSDIPAIRRHHIERAFRALGSDEFVFGPATDGGYWLIGAKRVQAYQAGLLQGVRWSSEHALNDSIANLAGRRFALVSTLSDVDIPSDL